MSHFSAPRPGHEAEPLLSGWRQLLDEADLCATHAREAAQCGRFCAACGLLITANALCLRALESPSARSELLVVEGAVTSRLGYYQDEVDALVERAVAKRLAYPGVGEVGE